MADDKPHLVLDWILDCNTQELTCTIDEDLKYYSHNGGYNGFTKVYLGEEKRFDYDYWESYEKNWLSEHYGETVGYFQPDTQRVALEPTTQQMEGRKDGLGKNGEYIDHMGRSQRLLNGGDMAQIVNSAFFQAPRAEEPAPLFHTPDNGLTIYKTLPTANTFYNGRHNKNYVEEDGTWQQTAQPCMMQPFSKGRILSSYEEMEIAGAPVDILDRCKAGEYDNPPYPEYQANFVYPTVNTSPITTENVGDIWD